MGDVLSLIEKQLRAMVANQFEVTPGEVTAEANFEILGADSLDVVELVMKVEEKFQLEIPESDAKEIVTFGDLVAYVKKQLATGTKGL